MPMPILFIFTRSKPINKSTRRARLLCKHMQAHTSRALFELGNLFTVEIDFLLLLFLRNMIRFGGKRRGSEKSHKFADSVCQACKNHNKYSIESYRSVDRNRREKLRQIFSNLPISRPEMNFLFKCKFNVSGWRRGT